MSLSLSVESNAPAPEEADAPFAARGRQVGVPVAVEVAASILTSVWHMQRDGCDWEDLGPEHFARRDREAKAKALAKQIRQLGFEVTIQSTGQKGVA